MKKYVIAIIIAIFSFIILTTPSYYTNGVGTDMSISTAHSFCNGIVSGLNSECKDINSMYMFFSVVLFISLLSSIFLYFKERGEANEKKIRVKSKRKKNTK